MNKICVIDGSHLAFRNLIAHAYLGVGRIKTGVTYGFLKSLLKIDREFKVGMDNMVVCWDFGKSDWRLRLYPEYKAGRAKGDIDITSYRDQLKMLREALELLGVAQFGVQGVEADDLIGILSNRYYKEGSKVLVYSGDQDMYQLVKDEEPGVVVIKPPNNDVLMEQDILRITGVLPKQIPDFKALVGDKSDNIQGVKGVGKVKAARLLKDYKCLEVLLEVFKDQKGLIESLKVQERYREEMNNLKDGKLLLNKKITTILRDSDKEALTENQIFTIDNWVRDITNKDRDKFVDLLRSLNMISLLSDFFEVL